MLDFIKSLMGRSEIIYVGFEDMKVGIRGDRNYVIINTLSSMDQSCLIYGTLAIEKEESVINEIMNRGHKDDLIIILYGRHSADSTVVKKRKQLIDLGFGRVYIYGGGLFEWLLLQEIYGVGEFPTTAKCTDLLRFRPPPVLSQRVPALTF